MTRKHYTRICADCGKVMHNVAPNRKLCPECVHSRDLVRQRENEAIYRESTSYRKRVQHVQARAGSLRDDVLAAKHAGLSYGKYMLTKNKKPAGAGNTGEPAKG